MCFYFIFVVFLLHVELFPSVHQAGFPEAEQDRAMLSAARFAGLTLREDFSTPD